MSRDGRTGMELGMEHGHEAAHTTFDEQTSQRASERPKPPRLELDWIDLDTCGVQRLVVGWLPA